MIACWCYSVSVIVIARAAAENLHADAAASGTASAAAAAAAAAESFPDESRSCRTTGSYSSCDDALGVNEEEDAVPTRTGPSATPKNAFGSPRDGDKLFICNARGRALPVLQVMGVQKSASTTLYTDLYKTIWLRQDIDCRNPALCKELFWFDRYFANASYDSHWGRCDDEPRGVIGDFTTSYSIFPSVPRRMMDEYGVPRYQEIVFVVALREPLKRALAAYAHGRRYNWQGENQIRSRTFQEHVARFLAQWGSAETTADRDAYLAGLWKTEWITLYAGLYYDRMRAFLDAGFKPAQFVIFPGNVYLQNRRDLSSNPVLEALRARLGPNVLRPESAHDKARLHVGLNHKRLKYELTNATLKHVMDEVFGPANEKLAEFLGEGLSNGMTLVGYTGEADDVEAIGKWLDNGWAY